MKVFKNPITGETFEDISVAKRAYCTTHPCTSGGCKFHNVVPEFKKCDEWAAAHPEEAAELMGLVMEEVEAETVDKPFTGEIPGEVCSDNRFELIEKYKTKLINGTNIGAVKEEMAVIDNILFRFWQMGWLDTLEKAYAQTMNTKNMGEKTGDSPARPRLAEVLGVEVGKKFRILRSGIEFECVIGENGMPLKNMWEALYAINHPESIIRAPRLTEPEIAIMRDCGAKWVSRDDDLDDGRVDLWENKPIFDRGAFISGDGNPPVARALCKLFETMKPGDCIGLEG